MKTNAKKICLAASSGGHLTQLLKMMDGWKEHDAVYVTSSDVVLDELTELGKTYVIGECNRQHAFQLLSVFFRSVKIAVKERPDYVLSTGSAPGFMMCLAGKMVGAKVLWIDSIANVKKISLSGRLVRPFANMFLTQWPGLADSGKRIEFYGSVL